MIQNFKKRKIPVILMIIISMVLNSVFTIAQTGKYKDQIYTASKNIEEKVINWRRNFHQNPELGSREFKTAEIVANHLKSLGLEVYTGIAKTGVKGILKGKLPGPVIALRADMDALPITERTNVPFASKVKTTYNGKETGVMHACGHDSHVAILMGVAEILAGMKDKLKGTVVFIFQPAEEGAPVGEEGGAELMIKEGVLENPKVDAIFGLHISSDLEVGKIKYKAGPIMAGVSDFKITVDGKGSHGSTPWTSVDPIVVSAQIINNIQTIVSRNINLTENPAVVTIGSINGGNRSNIIPEVVEMLGTIRVFSDKDEKLVYERLRMIVENTAESFGAKATINVPYSSHYPVNFNNEQLTANILTSLGNTVGKENLILTKPLTAAEDFAFYSQNVPGFYFFLGGMPKGQNPENATPHHTPDFYIDESGFIYGLNAFSNLVFDYSEIFLNNKKTLSPGK